MKNKPLTTWFYPLFKHMDETHGLMIVESEAEDIIAAVEQCQKRRADTLAPTVARAVRKMAGNKRKPYTCIHNVPFDSPSNCPACNQMIHEFTAGPAVNPRRG